MTILYFIWFQLSIILMAVFAPIGLISIVFCIVQFVRKKPYKSDYKKIREEIIKIGREIKK